MRMIIHRFSTKKKHVDLEHLCVYPFSKRICVCMRRSNVFVLPRGIWQTSVTLMLLIMPNMRAGIMIEIINASNRHVL
jgi:hypothetical protein